MSDIINTSYIIIFRSSSAFDVFPDDTIYDNIASDLEEIYLTPVETIYYDIYGVNDMISNLCDLICSQKNIKILHVVIQAHGKNDCIILGNDTIDININNENMCRYHDFIELISNILSKSNGSIFLHSCSTAKHEYNIAKYTTNLADVPLFASTNNIHMGDLEIRINNNYQYGFGLVYKVKDTKFSSQYKIILYDKENSIKITNDMKYDIGEGFCFESPDGLLTKEQCNKINIPIVHL